MARKPGPGRRPILEAPLGARLVVRLPVAAVDRIRAVAGRRGVSRFARDAILAAVRGLP